ncbi:MAG: hypothetical protein OEU80_10470 [Deltaproteobacteria bacterium]|nr:hypothetical protein [Deltaproteobacteria bacterium]MDH3802496.1 hypothetical protein [Deltaproteobacteria bacterium]MDH3951764.1 hypothetical protein [Deltaproteobacteria bacterium]
MFLRPLRQAQGRQAPRDYARDRQDRLTLRRTVQVRLGFDLGFRILDLGFLTTIDDIELNSSDFAICSLVLSSFSANFQSAFRNRRPGGTPFSTVSRHQFVKHPG